MTKQTQVLPELGKIDPTFFDRVIFPRLGAKDASILIGPRHGVDYGAIAIGDQVAVMSTDPVFIAPSLGWERAAWFALHIIASDVAVSGIMPRYLSIDLNLPPETQPDTLEIIWNTIHEEAEKLGITVITGHTARYAGCNYPMVGGATIIGVGSKDRLLNPANAKAGDAIIITKGAAVEATGLMAVQFPEFLEEKYGAEFVQQAKDVFFQMSVVEDARIVAETGAAVAMHDATECGVYGGLYEMAKAGKFGVRIEKNKIVVQDVVSKTCSCFQMDPYSSISEGTLIAIVENRQTDAVLNALKTGGIPATVVGEVVPESEGIKLMDGHVLSNLEHPVTDPFWGRFEEFLKKQAARK